MNSGGLYVLPFTCESEVLLPPSSGMGMASPPCVCRGAAPPHPCNSTGHKCYSVPHGPWWGPLASPLRPTGEISIPEKHNLFLFPTSRSCVCSSGCGILPWWQPSPPPACLPLPRPPPSRGPSQSSSGSHSGCLPIKPLCETEDFLLGDFSPDTRTVTNLSL